MALVRNYRPSLVQILALRDPAAARSCFPSQFHLSRILEWLNPFPPTLSSLRGTRQKATPDLQEDKLDRKIGGKL
ncbi:hypothetical protein PtA15_3A47 [Puccinia triticina]|uniref:Uncharacterized protein n=1 Tax=Puccinia triticina TaxID=208348 RepID=A0ABY7CCA9_9BASI|nr:uncharacterized protein PtA15_3A47 [Puccinia triticina]WAQ82684.1 hypothetical protein PtA15_3A47 [Puccinia triticina]